MDSPLGRRRMHTFRKLPMTAPKMNASTYGMAQERPVPFINLRKDQLQ